MVLTLTAVLALLAISNFTPNTGKIVYGAFVNSTNISVSCTPDTIYVNGTTVISGMLLNATNGEGIPKGIPNQPVNLYYDPCNGTWIFIKTVYTDDTGMFTFPWYDAQTLPRGTYWINATFWGITTPWGTTAANSSTSLAVLYVLALPTEVSITCTPQIIYVNGTVTITGSLINVTGGLGLPGMNVSLYYDPCTGVWQLFKIVKTDSEGGILPFVWNVPAELRPLSGGNLTVYIKAEFEGTATYNSSYYVTVIYIVYVPTTLTVSCNPDTVFKNLTFT
jgi:hypothetical protein